MAPVNPPEIVAAMIQAGAVKAMLRPFDLLVRGFLSGALLGFATSLALGATVTTGQPLVGALIFPVGFVMIVLLGLELVTGSFALLPLAPLHGKSSWGARPPRPVRVCPWAIPSAAGSMAESARPRSQTWPRGRPPVSPHASSRSP